MTHGVTLTESTDSTTIGSVRTQRVIGLVATASAAVGDPTDTLNAAFPVGALTLITDLETAIKNAGTGGTLAKALAAIGDVVNPVIVVSRAAIDADEEDMEANVIAAVELLLHAESTLAQRPRILGAPGLDKQEITNKLVIVAKKLRGIVYARSIGETVAEACLYRREYGARELMLIWPDTNDWTGDAVARALGLRAQIDKTIGYHKTLSNVVIDGVTSISEPVHFDLLDTDNDAGVLNEADVTTIIQTDGARFWGNHTCAGDDQPDYVFESAVRTKYACEDIIETTIKPFIDKPMTVPQVRNLLEKMNAAGRAEVTAGRVIGMEFFYLATTTTAQLAAGRPGFRYRFTPCAPMENPNVDVQITDDYYSDFAKQLAS